MKRKFVEEELRDKAIAWVVRDLQLRDKSLDQVTEALRVAHDLKPMSFGINPSLRLCKPCELNKKSVSTDFHALRRGFIPAGFGIKEL